LQRSTNHFLLIEKSLRGAEGKFGEGEVDNAVKESLQNANGREGEKPCQPKTKLRGIGGYMIQED
jgi:hypothetical protein